MKKEQPPVEEKKAVEAVKTETPAQAKPAVPVFTAAALRASARKLFGVSQSTYDGATHGLDGEYTVEEMRKLIEKWLKEEY